MGRFAMPDSCDLAAQSLSPTEAVDLLAAGGLLLFPTETFYALGCLITFPESLAAILTLKGRNKGKPLPLAAASKAQIARFCDLDGLPAGLTAFWPGPLTLVLPLKRNLQFAPCLVNEYGQVAVRISAHPLPTFLAQCCGVFLTVSSANVQGRPPATSPSALDPELLDRLSSQSLPWGVLPHKPDAPPQGGLPSTIVRMAGEQLEILRQGALAAEKFTERGFLVNYPDP
ncbi:MAG: Sua5/YciO/YrdC/YwlC family protein [Desulfovibrio sp.]|nr:Sua5/YciO/YrdC/YwlC family protein [Desulfovibrio sp.]